MIEGRDSQYILAAQPIRILSLVPADAPDIRDGAPAMFSDLEERAFRANVFFVAAGVLFTLAGIAALALLVRLVRRERPAVAATGRRAADSFVLRGVGRELDEVWRDRQQSGWTPGLIDRALAGLRIVGAFALGRRVSVSDEASAGDRNGQEGVLRLRVGWLERRRVIVSSQVTGGMIVQALGDSGQLSTRPDRVDALEHLARALMSFTRAKYGSTGTLDENSLDDALTFGVGLQRRLRVEHIGLVKKYRAATGRVRALETRVWSR